MENFFFRVIKFLHVKNFFFIKKKMKELIGRNVDIVDYYPKPFRQKDLGRFKISLHYPFQIKNIFHDGKTFKVDLEYRGKKKYPNINFKPLKYINFELNDMEKKNIIHFIEKNNIKELFHRYWYLRVDTIMNFLRTEYIMNLKDFILIENIGKKNHYRILFLMELYGFHKDKIDKNESLSEFCKKNNFSYLFFEENKVKEIYLDKKSTTIFFFYQKNNILLPLNDLKLIKKYNGKFLVMFIDEN